MEEELVSIIIPVYNAQPYIKDTIETIKQQTYQNWEAIFIDDCSTDESIKILKENLNSKMKIISLDKHSGPAIARNRGIQEAKGRFLSFLDADDLWDKNKTKEQIEWMKQHKYAFTYTGFEFANQKGQRSYRPIKVQEKLDYAQALKNTRILTIAVIIDTHQIKKEDCQMPDIMSEDIATWWNILKKGNIAYALNKPLVFYRISTKTRSSNKIKNSKYRWQLYRKVEKIPLGKSIYYFSCYVGNAILKRL